MELLDRTGSPAIVHWSGTLPIYALPKVKISLFKGETLAGGFDCKKYFMVHHTLEKQKVEIASLYLGEIADI